MHYWLAAINDLRRPEYREIPKPQACGFRFAMAELPRLNQLRGGGNGSADDADRVLNAPSVDRCSHQQSHEIEGLGLLLLLAMEVPGAADSKMRAWRMGNHEIPSLA